MIPKSGSRFPEKHASGLTRGIMLKQTAEWVDDSKKRHPARAVLVRRSGFALTHLSCGAVPRTAKVARRHNRAANSRQTKCEKSARIAFHKDFHVASQQSRRPRRRDI